jgi:hypothetical protein
MPNNRGAIVLAVFLLVCCCPLFAGGPLYVGGNYGIPGKPFTWDNSQPIQYRVDGGTLGKLSHADAVQMVNAAFNAWANVPTAALSFICLLCRRAWRAMWGACARLREFPLLQPYPHQYPRHLL